MSRAALILAAVLALIAPMASAESIDGQAPYVMIRSLQILQEQIAQGNGMAQAAQPKLISHIAERFLAADLDVWREPRNARAAITFLLSGGNPSVIRAILAKTAMPIETDKLLKGALAYAEGNDEIARQLLGDIDARSLPSSLGGHLALVQASLVSGQDGPKASKLLDVARLLVPGTLVEEAALRRQVFMLAGPETFDKFVYLSRQYIRRFRASTYADNFRQRLKTVAVALAKSGDLGQLNKFDAIIGEMVPAEQLNLYLTIAKFAIVEGKPIAARLAAEKAATLAGDQSGDGARSRLYAGAALIVSDDTVKGLQTLEAVDRSRLTELDAELRDAAIAVATGVRAESQQKPWPSDGSAEKAADGADPSSAALIERARTAVSNTDKLLGGQHP